MSAKLKKIKKWLKWFFITIGSFLGLIIVLAIVFNQLTFRVLMGLGYQDVYSGNNERGNEIMTYAISKYDTVVANDYRHWSVQNTKNGNYSTAIGLLEKSMEMNPEEISRYYGWLLLYYYRDYEKALPILEQYDALTPNFSDAPMGEDIHYLKGLCHMQLGRYQKALDEFDTYINNLARTHGEDFVDVYTFVQKGRCLKVLGRYDEAISSYKKAIKYYGKCPEAYYFMGLTQLDMNDKDSACTNFNIALDLIKKGHKSSDTYVEYFHEIYPKQIELSIAESCKD
jgi:tetratricopeptide (TPR) repeat protein